MDQDERSKMESGTVIAHPYGCMSAKSSDESTIERMRSFRPREWITRYPLNTISSMTGADRIAGICQKDRVDCSV